VDTLEGRSHDVVIILDDREIQEKWFDAWVEQPTGGLHMPPEWISSVLLPDGQWHDIVRGSMDMYPNSAFRFIEKDTGLKYIFEENSVLAVRGSKRGT
jgi:hypothetical protein